MAAAHRKKGSTPTSRFHIGRKGPALKFLGSFIGLMLLFYLLYYSSFYQILLSGPIESAQAAISGALLRALGFQAAVTGDAISGGGFSVQIAKGCDGIEPLAMFLCAILAFPIVWRLKWPGLIAGTLVLGLLNIVRITGLFLAGLYIPTAFEFLHLHGGFVLFTVMAILVWMTWANWAIKRLRSPSQNAT
jgi:exosortase/archaeosortase family protein